MNIENLKCFLLVAENLSFARAAEALYISQPAVTKQISALERELGTALLIRSTRHVELTPAGMAFYKDAKEIVLKAQMAVSRLQRQSTAWDSVRIGLSNATTLSYIAPILARFHRENPDIIPHIEVLNYKVALHLFLENKIELLFYYKENMPTKTGFCYRELEQDRIVCLVPSSSALAGKEIVTMEELEQETILACNPLNAPAAIASLQNQLLNGRPAEKVVYCESVEVAHCLVSAGIGVVLLPSILSPNAGDLVAVPFAGGTQLSFGVFYKRKKGNRVLERLLKAI